MKLSLPALPAWARRAPRAAAGPRASRRVRQVIREPAPRGLPRRALWALGRLSFRPWPLVGLAAMAAGACAFHQFFTASPYFELRETTVVGNERLPERAILDVLAGDEESVHLVRFDTRAATARLLENPLVQEADVIRRWPSSLDIYIRERRPAAILLGASSAWLVDDSGLVFAEALSRDLLDDRLPVLTLAGRENPGLGEKLPAEFRESAFLYADVLATTTGRRLPPLSEAHWDPSDGLTLYLENGVRVRCGRRPPSHTLPRVEALAAKLGGTLAGVDSVDVRMDTHLAWTPMGGPQVAASQ